LSSRAFRIKTPRTSGWRKDERAMHAETETMVLEIKQSLELLRRHL
jgi:hypothetical protein